MSSPSRRKDGSIRSCIIHVSIDLMRKHFQVPAEAELDAVFVNRLQDRLEFQFLGIGPVIGTGIVGAVAPVVDVLCTREYDKPLVPTVKFTWPKGEEV